MNKGKNLIVTRSRPAKLIIFLSLIIVLGLIYQCAFVNGITNGTKTSTSYSKSQWNLSIRLNVDSIDMRTEKVFTSYYSMVLWSSDNSSGLWGLVIKPDKSGAYGFATDVFENNTERQRFSNQITTDPTKVQPWDWKVHPMNRFLGLASPLDYYELSIMIAVNEAIQLQRNDTTFALPQTLQGEWTYNEHFERLSKAPDNATLSAHGIDVSAFTKYQGNDMMDFYLYTVSLSPMPAYTLRMFVAFLIPPIVILIVLIFVALNYHRLSRSNLFTIYLATAFFILPFMVSFYQYATPAAFTWQECLFLFDFLFVSSLISYTILKKSDSDK